MFKLMRYLKKYWYFAILGPTFMMAEVAMDLMLTSYMEKIVDYGIQTSNLDNIIKYGLMMLAIVFIGVVSGILSGVFTNIASYRFSNDLRKDLFKKIMSLSYDQTDDFQTGSLVTRVTNDITEVQGMITTALRMMIRAISFFILGIVFTIQISSRFTYILLILLPIEIIIILIFMKIVFPVFSIIQKKLDKVNTVVHENVTGARVVKAFGKEDYESERFGIANNEYTGVLLKVNKTSAFLMPMLTLIIYSGQIIIYSIGGSSIIEHFKSALNLNEMIMVGQISQAITYISMICSSVVMLAAVFTNMARATASAKRINEILDAKLDIIDGNLNVENINKTGIVELKNVFFRYPGSDIDVLKNINLKIKQGETLAIVGATGCGKSSLVNLLPRFYDATEGEVLVDGENVKDYKQTDLRDKISMALQKSELFKGTIAENIKWGNTEADQEEVIEAARIAQASEFIDESPDGYDTIVEEKGTSLSGGQKQRLSIARAIIKKPEIMVFDDSTSALDLVTEANLYKAMNEAIPYVTKIVVCQRVATAKNADRIAVLEKGTIIACDTHEVLIKTCAVYQDIYNSQMK